MNKAVFLDRDGVINDDTGHYYIYKSEDFVFTEGLVEALKIFINHGFLLIVITNQGGVNRGTYNNTDVDLVHRDFVQEMDAHGIQITEIYYCPHHPNYQKCLCRKPNSVSFEKALARFNIDANQSFMVGDNFKDVEAAEKVGVKGIKIETNQSLLSIVDQIIDESKL